MPTTEKLKQEIADAEKKLAQERSRLQLIIPGFFEPPVRILRAAIPENESHAFR